MSKYFFKINNTEYQVEVLSDTGAMAEVKVNGKIYKVDLSNKTEAPKEIEVKTDKELLNTPIAKKFYPPKNQVVRTSNVIYAPLPGYILELAVSNNTNVKKGDKLAILEAMKMENEILAPKDGIIAEVHIKKGDSVMEGDKLFTFK